MARVLRVLKNKGHEQNRRPPDYGQMKNKNATSEVRIFTALHGMQTRSYDENSVRPSVRPSVCPSVRLSNACIVTKRKKAMFRFLYHTKNIYPSFLRRRMVGGGAIPST